MDSNFSYRGTKAPNSEASRASRVALAPERAMLAAACTAVIAEARRTAALCGLACARLSTRNDACPAAHRNGVLVAAPRPFREHAAVDGRLPEPYRMGRADFGALRLIGIFMPNLLATVP